jgi:hypothetical protein
MTEIRLIQRDAAAPRRGRSDAEASTAPSPDNLNPLTRGVAHASIEEIDRIFLELQRIRDVLHAEGARLSGELARYATLNQSVQATMKVISESLKPIASAR